MAIPSEKDIEVPLLEEIQAMGGEARPSDLYDRVASHFPQLTSVDRTARYPRSGLTIWTNRVQWARQHLVHKGEIDGAVRGVWKVTQKGRERIAREGIEARPLSLVELVERHAQEVREELRERVMVMEPDQFEVFAGQLLRALGFTDVQITGRSGDGGIDGHGSLELGVVKVKGAFQFKRWQQNVPRPVIDQFRGAITGLYDQGIFITTSDFTGDAKQVSSRPGTVPIVMINGEKIIDTMLEKGLGVKREPLAVTWLDEDFFAQFGEAESSRKD